MIQADWKAMKVAILYRIHKGMKTVAAISKNTIYTRDEINQTLHELIEQDLIDIENELEENLNDLEREQFYYLTIAGKKFLKYQITYEPVPVSSVSQIENSTTTTTQIESPSNENEHQLPEHRWVNCPYCHTRQKYGVRSQKRMHKYCSNATCKKHFDIKPIQTQIKPKGTSDAIKSELHEIDKNILKAFFDNTRKEWVKRTQNELVQIVAVNKSTVSRHLKQLLETKLITVFGSSILPNAKQYYEINRVSPYVQPENTNAKNPDTDESEEVEIKDQKPKSINKQSGSNNIHYAQCHNVKIGVEILTGSIPKEAFEKPWKMNNWKDQGGIFTMNGLEFQVSPLTITFWPTGYGKTPELALQNLHDKAGVIKDALEQKYQLQLGNPVVKSTKLMEYVLISCDNKTFKKLEAAWSDRSHKYAVETTSRKFVQDLLDMRDTVSNQKTKINELDAKNTDLESKYTELKTELTNLKEQPLSHQPPTPVNNPDLMKSIRSEIDKCMNQQLGNMKTELKDVVQKEIKEMIPGICQAFAGWLKDNIPPQAPKSLPENPGPAPDDLYR